MSLFTMRHHYVIAMAAYVISVALDYIDGPAARVFKQETSFGALMDLVTDRCTSTCLMVMLSSLHPEYMILLQILLSLDIASHWFHHYRPH
ncbi:uncharacterized protein [Apostichopus japonicus]|uniref:uncharacterized protein n=1 Tax=Stichopus japonicus TaxID=307972 RepID=UPI003AB7ACFB